jgi:hypothetical protein
MAIAAAPEPMLASGGKSSSAIRLPSAAVRHEDVDHPLVVSAKAIGEATAVLPVVSTLVFGFAITELLDAEAQAAAHPVVLLLLTLSACFSLYTTTFSILEFYYVTMIHAFDSKAAHGNRAYQMKTDRENLSFQVDAAIHVHTRRMRKHARDCLWYSVTCLVAATGVQTVAVHGWTWYSIPVVVIGVAGVLVVPWMVFTFRGLYLPLVAEYRGTSALADVLAASSSTPAVPQEP